MKDGFWNIELDEESSKLCTFNSPFGRYSFTRLPFGIKSAPEVFQKRMSDVFGNIPGIFIVFDDIITAACDDSEHDTILRQLFERARLNNVRFNRNKLQLKVPQVRYLGHLLTSEGVEPDPDKLSAIADMSPPTDKKGVHRLIGTLKYLSKFVPNFSDQSKPLRDLLRNDVSFVWQPEHQCTFDKLKSAIISAPVLSYFDPHKPISIQTDASSTGLGSCLMQEGKPVAFASRALSETETRYAQIEKELLAIVFACLKFHQYIYGQDIIVQSDHKPLEAIFRKPLSTTTPRLQRMLLKLLPFSLNIVYTPGKQMFIADTLSRAYLPSTPSSIEQELADDMNVMVHSFLHEFPASNTKLEEFRRETDADPELYALKCYLRDCECDHHTKLSPMLNHYSRFLSDICELDGMLFLNNRIIVPKSMQRSMLCIIHEGHLGMEKCKSLARQCVYWPGINRDIEHIVSSCAICQSHRKRQASESLMPHPIPERPWQKIGADIFTLRRKDYLLVVDYYSKFPEVMTLSDKSATAVIQCLKTIFARHGIPDEMFSDNNPFNSQHMISFAREWNFNLTTSSPTYAQSNGMVERSIQTIKSLFSKAMEEGSDVYVALLQHRNAPITELGLSPAQLLFSRRLKTKLPATFHSLQPEVHDARDLLLARQQRQKHYFDRSTRDLPALNPDDVIRVQHDGELQRGIVRQVLDTPRSYVVETEHGSKLRRNRRHLIKTREPPPACGFPIDDSSTSSSTTVSSASPTMCPSGPSSSSSTVSSNPKDKPGILRRGPVVTRSGRVSRPPVRFKDFV